MKTKDIEEITKERYDKIKDIKDKLNKTYGKGALMSIDDGPVANIETTPTGSLLLDKALGVGGYPKGRILEIYGPESSGKTTLAIHAMVEVQKAGGIAAFIDAEHALDLRYAQNLGLNIQETIFSQPDTAEQALNIVEDLVRLGEVDFIVVDSVSALTPQAEVDGDMGASHMGLQARLMGQACRKLTGLVGKNKCNVLFINQVRHKIGVMFGCLSYNTKLNFVDGRTLPIGKVVDEKISGDVWCYNEKTGEITTSPIIDWHDNGTISSRKDMLHFLTESCDCKGGKYGFSCTLDHKILTNSGWKKARDITLEDKLITKYKSNITDTLKDFLCGTLVGDSTINMRKKNKSTGSTANLRIQDNTNREYATWKIQKLSPHFVFKKTEYNNLIKFVSQYSTELRLIKDSLGQRDPNYFFDNYSDLGLALWFMDDAHYNCENSHNRYRLSIGRLGGNKKALEKISSRFVELGLDHSFEFSKGIFTFTTAATNKIAMKIAKYVPKCMQYKLPEAFKGQYIDFALESASEYRSTPVKILEIAPLSKRLFRSKRKFDIAVKDHHNYMVGGASNGAIVHNSPETTSGGNALKFYASVRLDIRRKATNKTGDVATSNEVKIKVVKNKVAPPFTQADTEILFGKGINKMGEIIDLAVEYGLMNKAGAWYKYDGENVGQGKEKTIAWLESQPEILEYLEEQIREFLY